MSNSLRKLWDWFSWGKPLPGSLEAELIKQEPKTEVERREILQNFIRSRIQAGYQVTYESGFQVTLKKQKRVPVAAFIIVNFSLFIICIFFWILFFIWIPIFILWLIIFVNRVLNRREIVMSVEVDPLGFIRPI